LQGLNPETLGLGLQQLMLGSNRLPIGICGPDAERATVDVCQQALKWRDDECDRIGRAPRPAAPRLDGEKQQAHEQHGQEESVFSKFHR
jgi:hypothetical protein